MTATGAFLFKAVALALVGILSSQAAMAADVTRCGWYENPTPGNHWLTDRHSTWILSTQGGAEVPGWMDLPAEAFSFEGASHWVETNGSYGYGCACITGEFGAADSGAVLHVSKLEALPLSRCTADRTLPAAGG